MIRLIQLLHFHVRIVRRLIASVNTVIAAAGRVLVITFVKVHFEGRIILCILLHQLEVIVTEGTLRALRRHASKLIHVGLHFHRVDPFPVLITTILATVLVAKHRLDCDSTLVSDTHLVLTQLRHFLRVGVTILVVPIIELLYLRSIRCSLWRGGQDVLPVLLLLWVEAAVDKLVRRLIMCHEADSTWRHPAIVLLSLLDTMVHLRGIVDPTSLENVR